MKNTTAILMLCITILCICSGCKSEIEPINSDKVGSMSSLKDDSSTSSRLTLNGSTSMTKLCNSLGEAFMDDNPGVTVEKSDTGSGSAVKSVRDGTSLLGDLSRQLKSEEAMDVDSKVIAIDAIAVIVNKDNPVENISIASLQKVFTGKITNWSELGGVDKKITLIGREESSGTREGFESIVGINGMAVYHAEYPESGDIVSKVGADDSAIGYCSLFSVYGKIKALRVDSVDIKEENIKNGSYKIQRPFIQVYLRGIKNTLIDSWFDFIGSDKGVSIIKREKLIPVL